MLRGKRRRRGGKLWAESGLDGDAFPPTYSYSSFEWPSHTVRARFAQNVRVCANVLCIFAQNSSLGKLSNDAKSFLR